MHKNGGVVVECMAERISSTLEQKGLWKSIRVSLLFMPLSEGNEERPVDRKFTADDLVWVNSDRHRLPLCGVICHVLVGPWALRGRE